jgi:hypothetical protein
MQPENRFLRTLIRGMREAYANGENAMAYARGQLASAGQAGNSVTATLVAYDLQAGSYVEHARSHPDVAARWGGQLAAILDPLLPTAGSLLEVGCGEATTLASVLEHLGRLSPGRRVEPLGFDVSWSRISVANDWLDEHGRSARLFVADLFHIPLADGSVDVVYTSHSLEPNGGREREAIAELLRVARSVVVLVEPCYEMAGSEARARMESHGYVRGLRAAAESLGAEVVASRLLEFVKNPLNPSGLVVLRKPATAVSAVPLATSPAHACPLTGAPLESLGDVWWTPELGLAYPVIRGISLLAPEHVFVASRLALG